MDGCLPDGTFRFHETGDDVGAILDDMDEALEEMRSQGLLPQAKH